MRFDPLGQPGALDRAPITNANACLMYLRFCPSLYRRGRRPKNN